jgi:hypothetical protein
MKLAVASEVGAAYSRGNCLYGFDKDRNHKPDFILQINFQKGLF